MENKNIGISILKSLIFSYILTGIILCILAFIMYQTEVSTKVANLGVTFTYVAAEPWHNLLPPAAGFKPLPVSSILPPQFSSYS